MAEFELDSFYIKFKNLLYTEKDAVLNIKSEAGRAHVSLSLDLGHIRSVTPYKYRNSPSQQRRRARRQAERNKVSEKALNDNSKEESAEETEPAVKDNGIVIADQVVNEVAEAVEII